jgi:hypothetical protein
VTEHTVKTFPSIQGHCPACRGDSLFIGSGGYVTCSRLDCPNPSAADQLLHGETPPQAAIARVRALCAPEQNTAALGYLRRSQDVLAALDAPTPPDPDRYARLTDGALWYLETLTDHQLATALDRTTTTLNRIRALTAEHPVGIDTALIHAALDEHTPTPTATQATDGPSIRECADADRRHWNERQWEST